MSTSVGIDLGTTYSCAIHQAPGGAETAVEAHDGGELTPSVVYFGADGQAVVGAEAKRMLGRDPANVVTGIKRQMGHVFPLEFHGQRYTPESISGLILRRLAADAAQVLSVPVADLAAVITVPAYFGVAEREATYAAAEIAGLRCLQLLAEPVAAAYAYGLATEPKVTSLVFDLGGGTFDVAVVGMHRGAPRVWAVDGETQLGGIDWDSRVQDLLWAQVDELPDAEELRYDEDVMGAVEDAAERVKRQLTGRAGVTERVRLRGRTLQLRVDREAFEEAAGDLVVRCLDTVIRVVEKAAALDAPAVGQVLLVGGSTRMPMIREALRTRLRLPVRLTDPDKAVARGAALLAAQLAAGVGKGPGGGTGPTPITPVLPRSIGILLRSSREPYREEPYVQHFVPANTPLPIDRREHVVATVANGQERARIQLYEQGGAVPSPEPADNRVLLDGEIVGIPPHPAGSPLSLFVSVDLDGRLTVASADGAGRRVTLEVEAFIHGVLDDAEVAEQRRLVAGLTLEGSA
ncbi:Hsp70 family protein [Frankia sp. AgB1.9]|uniref:Hsp70 family protein n=1 Tax=unclassified Frankia TaxID=2632575 RepID=UPI00193313A7|nr:MULTISPECIES: Hsp70 family protein [unclassified Frankia]MBL7489625.1 Hsp70 family protein [Frankia sp. AgW1.1]MBL7547332.1 Hsp70 family protein [Frankia sp. AgB1.9]MBL7618731.1 Hsp70 family protein [Frankia sp. AgB1.8]